MTYTTRYPDSGSEEAGANSAPASGSGATVGYGAMLGAASSPEDAASLVKDWLLAKVGKILGLAEADVDASKPMHPYGIDSLVAIDLKNWLARKIGADVEVLTLLGNMSLETIAAVAAESSLCCRKKYEEGRGEWKDEDE